MLLSLTRVLRRFSADRQGSVAIMFGLALLPLLAAVGAGVDYSRAASARTALQAAADATALMLSKTASTMTAAQLQLKATAIFNELYVKADTTNNTVTPTFTLVGGSQVKVEAKSTIKTYFIKVVGPSSINLTASSVAKWGSTRLRVALVLDTTGSMSSDGKIDALKTSTKNLLTQLQAAASTDGDVLVSIVPFSKNVNAGASNYNATWIDWTDWEDEPASIKTTKPSNWESVGPGSACPFTTSNDGFRCAPSPVSSSEVSNIPSSGTYNGYICPGTDTGGDDTTNIGILYNGCYTSVNSTRTIATGSSASCGTKSNCSCSGSGSSKVCTQSYISHPWVKNARNTWTGCVTDRGAAAGPVSDYDRKITAPSTSIVATLFPAEQSAYCSPQVTALNYNWATMKTSVDALYPLGATNQPIGLVWGWQSLVGGGPFPTPPAKDTNYTYSEVIVLMSDGLNTLNRWNGNGSSVNTSVDKRMYESTTLGTCVNAKAAGITIYAVHVNTGGDPKSTLLESCASGTDKFWMVTASSGLDTVFKAIGTNLSQLRIAQ